MPRLTIDGREIEAPAGQTVMEAATAAGIFIPYFCWHPELSVPGNCRICVVGVEDKGGEWVEIACNMPVTEGMVVYTNSEKVRARRKATMQFITLNHPVDCGICDKAGECTLQDYHYEYNGERSISVDAKAHATKHYALSPRIVLDNERCIQCTRCVRFTREISKSNGLGMQNRADHSLVRAVEDGSFANDPYSDNVIDICPVGALLSRSFLHKARVWYLKPTASVCPGCARGCTVNLWHRRPEWRLRAPGMRAQNETIDRVTPLENPAVNGPWICNKGRDLAQGPRARARRGGDAQGPPRRAAGGDRAGPLAHRGRPQARGRRLELGLQRGARGVQGGPRRALRRDREGRPRTRAGRGGRRTRSSSAPTRTPTPRAPARSSATRRSRFPRTPTWSSCGARASTSASSRPGRRSSTSTPGCSRRTGTPTSSSRRASRRSATGTTPTSRA